MAASGGLAAIAEEVSKPASSPKEAPAGQAAKSGDAPKQAQAGQPAKTGKAVFLVAKSGSSAGQQAPSSPDATAGKRKGLGCADAGGSRQKRKSISLVAEEGKGAPEEATAGAGGNDAGRRTTRAAAGQLPRGGAPNGEGAEADSWLTQSVVIDDEETETDDDFMPAKNAKVGKPNQSFMPFMWACPISLEKFHLCILLGSSTSLNIVEAMGRSIRYVELL